MKKQKSCSRRRDDPSTGKTAAPRKECQDHYPILPCFLGLAPVVYDLYFTTPFPVHCSGIDLENGTGKNNN
ncbi:hypothetical protein KAR48_14990 [bacterium]|nr:hypothetical protein [bacterium]